MPTAILKKLSSTEEFSAATQERERLVDIMITVGCRPGFETELFVRERYGRGFLPDVN